MDALQTSCKWRSSAFILIVLTATAGSTGMCRAGDWSAYYGGHGKVFDGSTLCRWHRTWHGPNSNWQPLTRYYVPRPADPCKYGMGHNGVVNSGVQVAGCCGMDESADFPTDYAVSSTANHAWADTPSLQPGFERLGQIPNDLGISSGGPIPTGPAGAAGR
jgi:hypothetical protein